MTTVVAHSPSHHGAAASSRWRRRDWLRAACLGVLAGAVGGAAAQATRWPQRTVRLLVAYPPGGASDGVARLLAQHLAPLWGVPVVVENRPGAGGALALERLARSAPDGHTLCFSAITPLTQARPVAITGFDPEADIVPVISVMLTPVLLVGSHALGATTFPQALARAAQLPAGLRWATSGVGTTGHLVLEQVRQQSGVPVTHVPYSGGARQIHDTVAGHVDLLSSNAAEPVLNHVMEGRLLPLAVGAPGRVTVLPEVPTLAELGFPLANRFSEFGMFAPSGLPAALLEHLNASLLAVLQSPTVWQQLIDANHQPTGGTPGELATTLRVERAAALRLLRRP